MKNTKAGFSLIEAVVTTVLIAIAAVAAFSFIVYCNHLAVKAGARVAAANFAREAMEGLYKRDYRDTSLNVQSGTSIDLPTGIGVFGSSLRDQHGGTRTYSVADKGDYKLITVTVRWN